ncbi:MAG: hypothetical protein GY785_18530 [Gammaproteobacteria bacterium]|nr:hypothetical protein [Gammaproteobacteria bacterium]
MPGPVSRRRSDIGLSGSLNENLLMRATIPINGDQPYWIPASGEDYADFVVRQLPTLDETTGEFSSGHDHLGNVGIDIGYGGVSDNGFINMIGIANQWPWPQHALSADGHQLPCPRCSLVAKVGCLEFEWHFVNAFPNLQLN